MRLQELRKAQEYTMQCQQSANTAEDENEVLGLELGEFKRLTKCHNAHELRMAMDSAEGELLTARALINAVREKAPDVYAEVIQ